MVSQFLYRTRFERKSGDLLDAACPLCSLLRRVSAPRQLDLGLAFTLQIEKIDSRLVVGRNGQGGGCLSVGQTYSKTRFLRSCCIWLKHNFI
jgi:hypothetical protein